jgi:hypothetical protein
MFGHYFKIKSKSAYDSDGKSKLYKYEQIKNRGLNPFELFKFFGGVIFENISGLC